MDTHVFLWAVLDDPALSTPQKDIIIAPETDLFLSAVSVWEISIKSLLGKSNVPQDIFETALRAGCQPLAVTWRHARAVEDLPQHHGDPFDRMLIAQAHYEGLTLATADAQIARYEVPIL